MTILKEKDFFCSSVTLTILKGTLFYPYPGEPFSYSSFKNKSSFNPTVTFQLESIFYQIDNELYKHTYKPVRIKILTQHEFKALKSPRRNQNIVIKLADKASAIVIMDKQYYIDEGIILLSSTDFNEELPTDISGGSFIELTYKYITCVAGVKSLTKQPYI